MWLHGVAALQPKTHFLFDVHHVNSLQADPDIDSFAFGPLENPLRWFVNLAKEESAPVCADNAN